MTTRTTPTGQALWSVPTRDQAIEAAGGRCQGAHSDGHRCPNTDAEKLGLFLDPQAGPVVLCPACTAGRTTVLTRLAAATGTGQPRRPIGIPSLPTTSGGAR